MSSGILSHLWLWWMPINSLIRMYYNTARWMTSFFEVSHWQFRGREHCCTWVHFKWQKSYFTCWWDLDKKWKETVVTRLKGIFGIWITVLFILHKKTATPVWTIMYLTLWSILKKKCPSLSMDFASTKKKIQTFFFIAKLRSFGTSRNLKSE